MKDDCRADIWAIGCPRHKRVSNQVDKELEEEEAFSKDLKTSIAESGPKRI